VFTPAQHLAMADGDSDQKPPAQRPVLSDKGREAEAERQAREAAALRQNLARRKRQQRARAARPAAADEA
jgi:hypothetical protein